MITSVSKLYWIPMLLLFIVKLQLSVQIIGEGVHLEQLAADRERFLLEEPEGVGEADVGADAVVVGQHNASAVPSGLDLIAVLARALF